MLYIYIFVFFGPISFSLSFSGVSPGCRTGVSIKSEPNSIFSAAVNVTASDLVVAKEVRLFCG